MPPPARILWIKRIEGFYNPRRLHSSIEYKTLMSTGNCICRCRRAVGFLSNGTIIAKKTGSESRIKSELIAPGKCPRIQ